MSDETSSTTLTEEGTMQALMGIIQQAGSQEAWDAQNILMRRLALQGDVVGSRVPSPRNITEIGGYLNLLTELQQSEMRSQALAGILGVAGPNPPLGWTASRPALSIVSLPNDRPEGGSQAMTPLTVAVRSDFVAGVQAAQRHLHERGCTLPLLSVYGGLPSALPSDCLPCLGRSLALVPAAALSDPALDPLALARPAGSSGAYELVARVLGPGSVSVPSADWEALRADAGTITPLTLNAAFVPLEPVLAAAGYCLASPLPLPSGTQSIAWTRMINLTSLVPGNTRLGDELAQLYSVSQIAGSVFADRLDWLWNGHAFVATWL